MDLKLTALERGFQMARSGRRQTVREIRLTLKKEGYDLRQVEGRTLTKQWTALIMAAKHTP